MLIVCPCWGKACWCWRVQWWWEIRLQLLQHWRKWQGVLVRIQRCWPWLRGYRKSKVCQRNFLFYLTQQNPEYNLDAAYKSYRISKKASALKICIPPSVDKRKCCPDKSPLSEAEDAPSSRKKKSKSTTKTLTKQSGKGVEDDSDDTSPDIVTKRAKKQCGLGAIHGALL